jgi:6-phosphogluconolactonase
MTTQLIPFKSAEEFIQNAAKRIAADITRAIDRRGICSLVLSGGSTPEPVYRQLATLDISWHAVHIFWGDDRHVPPDSADSNYQMARETLLNQISIPQENIHRIHTEFMSAEDAAEEYEQAIRNFATEYMREDEVTSLVPSFDIVLLGIGPDGHTASLFPHDPVLKEEERLVAATEVPELEPRRQRITMTFPLLNTAREVLFLASGRAKQEIIDTILSRPEAAALMYPSAWITPRDQRTFMIVEE